MISMRQGDFYRRLLAAGLGMGASTGLLILTDSVGKAQARQEATSAKPPGCQEPLLGAAPKPPRVSVFPDFDVPVEAAPGAQVYQELSASLATGAKEIDADEPLDVTITLSSRWGLGHHVFNPFLKGLPGVPGRLLVLDQKGRIVNRLFAFRGGSFRGPSEGDYFYLPSGGIVGTKMAVYPGRTRTLDDREGMLPPGQYTLQMEFFGSLINLQGGDRWKSIVVSERVPLRIVSRKASKVK
jgi:hypothetical protein